MPNNYNDWGEFAASLELRQEGFLEDLIKGHIEKCNCFLKEYSESNDVYLFYLVQDSLVQMRLLYCLLNKTADEEYKRIYLAYKNIKGHIIEGGING